MHGQDLNAGPNQIAWFGTLYNIYVETHPLVLQTKGPSLYTI
jgi:hypothetical protein